MLSQLRNFLQFMEMGGSLPCYPEPTNGPYTAPNESSPHTPVLFFLRTTFILSPIYVCVFQVVSFFHAFPPKGPDSVVGMTTLSGLENRGFLFRFPSDAREFSLLPSVQAGSGAHPVIRQVQKALFPEGKAPGE